MDTDASLELTPEALNRNIIRLAVPAVLENMLVTMVFFADGLLVGWMRDPVALAAVSMGGQFGWIANSLFSAIAVSAKQWWPAIGAGATTSGRERPPGRPSRWHCFSRRW